jgi:hypothetical protein
VPAKRQTGGLSAREARRRQKQAEDARAMRPTASRGGPPRRTGESAPPVDPKLEADIAQAVPPGLLEQLPPEERAELLRRAQELQDAAAKRADAGAGAGAIERTSRKDRAKRFVSLEEELAALLSSPGLLAGAAGDEYCMQHFTVRGPLLAARLTMLAEAYPSTYRTLHWMAKQGVLLVVLPEIPLFLLPPMVHHGLPVPEAMRRHLGVPEPHAHADLHSVA